MPTPSPYQEPPTRLLPTPAPTDPVAGRIVETDTATFRWTPVPEATVYEIEIAATEAFDPIYYAEDTARNSPLSIGDILPEDTATVFWRVRARRDDGTTSEWSEPAHFSRSSVADAKNESLRVDASPTPVHPTDETAVDQAAAPFAWEAVPEASGYQLQIGSSERFSDPVVDLTLDRTTTVTLCDMLSSDRSPFVWRVRALFPVETRGPWSEPVEFSVTPPAKQDDDRAREGADPQAAAGDLGPVAHSQTSRGMAIVVSLLAVVSFVVTIVLIALLG